MASIFEGLEVSELEENPSDDQVCVDIHRDLYELIGPEKFWDLVNRVGPKRSVPSFKIQEQLRRQVSQDLARGKPVTRAYQFLRLWETLTLVCARAPQDLESMFDLMSDQGGAARTAAGAFLNDAWARIFSDMEGTPGFDYFMRGRAREAYHLLKSVEMSDTPNWFAMSEDLATALLITDLEAVKSEDVQLPFPALYIEPPRGVIKVKAVDSDDLLVVDAISIVMEDIPETTRWALTTEKSLPESGQATPLVSGRRLSISLISEPTAEGRREGVMDNTVRTLSVPLAEGRDIQEMLEQERELILGHEEFSEDVASGSFFGQPLNLAEFRDRIYSFVINILLYMNSKEVQLDRVEQPKKKKAKKGKKAELRELTHPSDWILGSKVTIDPAIKSAVKESGGGARWKLKYQVFVRGHYRKQPYGPGRTKRKDKWIRPYVKGKGRLPGPALGHRYEDPGSSPPPDEPGKNPGPRIPLKTAEELGLTHEELEEQQQLAEEVIDEIIDEESEGSEENPVEFDFRPGAGGIGSELTPTLLEDDFDPRVLESGLYRAYSNTPAFPLLWGMTVTGDAVLAGYRYHAGGVVEMLAGIDIVGEAEANPQDVEKFQATVVVPHEAFTSIPEEEYGDTTWQQMWWREVIQNGIDAGATQIDCNVREQDDGTWLVSCQDNGHGMDVEGILSLFFTLKATKKFGETTIGGFGEAKKFIALAWINFRVRSQDAEVVGSGATWPNLDASRGHPQMKGTLVEVVMPADKHTTAQAAEDFIVKCYLPGVRFTVNGTPVKAALRAKKFKKDLPYETKLYEDKKGTINGALVRANGLYMFTEDLPSDYEGTVFIEMTPKREGYPTPKDLFSATRMDFRYGNEVSKAVREFLQLARSDVREALRNQEDLVRKEYEGAGLFSNTREQAAAVRDVAGALPEAPKGGSLMMTAEKQTAVIEIVKNIHVKASERVGGDESRTIGLIDPEIAAILFAHVAFKGESHLEAAVKQLVWKPDFLIMNDDTMRRRFRVDKRFEPETMTGAVLALAKCWAELVRLIFFASGTKAQWGTGFVFSKEAMGMYQEQPSGRKFICLNPISFETGKLYSIRNDEHLSKIFGIAIHECAHFVLGANDNYHGPSWAKAMSRLTEALLRYWPEAKRIAGKIKIRGAVPSVKERRKKRANQLDMMGEWLEDRDDREILMVYPLEDEDEKKYSREYLVPEDHLELFLYGEEAIRFIDLAGAVDASAAGRLVDAGTEAPTEFKVGREHVDNLVHDTFSPVEGSYKAPPEYVMPVRVRLRADGLLQMRPADRKMTRFITHPDDFDIPMSASIVVFAEEGYRGEGVEKLINAILREKLGVEPGTVESGDIKETLAGGKAITIPYDSYRYKELLRNHLRAIQLHLYFGDDADAPGDLMPRVGTIDVPVELDYNDNLVLDISQGDYRVWKYYTWVYDLPKDRGIRFRIREEWEKKKFLSMLPKPTVEVLESQGYINLTMNIDFFERLLEYHLDDARQAREKLDRHVAAELLGIEAEGNVATTIMGLGRNRDEVLVVVPALSQSRQSRLHDDFPESWDWPIRFFVYPGEEDYRWFEEDTEVMRSLHGKGVASKELSFLNAWVLLTQMFKSDETRRPGDYIPVTLKYHKGDETESVRIAPADPRHVRYMERHFGLAPSKMVIVQHGHDKARAFMEQVQMTTTIDPATASEMEENFWKGALVLGILDWDDYSLELQEQGVAVPARTAS